MIVLDKLNSWLTALLQNQWFTAALTLFLILYASMARPALPDFMVRLFDNAFFRLLVLFAIAYAASKNVTVALITSVVFALVMSMLSEQRMALNVMEGFRA